MSFVASQLDAGEAALTAYCELVGDAFASRPGPRSRFRAKFEADAGPTAGADPSLLTKAEIDHAASTLIESKRAMTRLAVHVPDGRLAGAVRLYARRWRVDTAGAGEASVCVAGLGEVCSHPSFRGRGVTSLLLPDALRAAAVMPAPAFGAPLSALHAAETVGPLYARHGYAYTPPIGYGSLAVPEKEGGNDAGGGSSGGCGGGGLRARPPLAPGEIASTGNDLWRRLAVLHATLCVRARLVGDTLRCEDYWRRWLPYSWADKLVLLEAAGASDEIVAYAAFVWKNGHYRLADAGASAAVLDKPGALRAALVCAAQAAMVRAAPGTEWAAPLPAVAPAPPLPPAVLAAAETAVATGGAWRPPSPAPGAPRPPPVFAVPSILMRLLPPAADGASAADAAGDAELCPELGDGGWMLRALAPSGEAALATLIAAARDGRFLVWLADSF